MITQTLLPSVLIFEPAVFKDERGFFYESFNQRKFCEALGKDISFVQDNHSRSQKGVLRGLHYQINQPQAKLVRVIRGCVFDIVVDIRKSSPQFGKWFGIELSENNRRQLWVPEGFAHGFLVLSDEADFLYKTTDYYSPADERCICWNDSNINIQWPSNLDIIISDKDKKGCSLAEAEVFC